MGKVSQYINSGDVANPRPAIKPAMGLKPVSFAKKRTNKPARKQVPKDKTVMYLQGLSVALEISHVGR